MNAAASNVSADAVAGTKRDGCTVGAVERQETVDAPSLNCFENRLNKLRSTRMSFFMD